MKAADDTHYCCEFNMGNDNIYLYNNDSHNDKYSKGIERRIGVNINEKLTDNYARRLHQTPRVPQRHTQFQQKLSV